MTLPLVLLADSDLARRLAVIDSLIGVVEARSTPADVEWLVRQVRAAGPALVLLAGESPARVGSVARALRTDLRAQVPLLLYGAAPGAAPPPWPPDLAPPLGWVPSVRDAEALRAGVRAALCGEGRWAEAAPQPASALRSLLGRLRRATMRA